MKRFFFPSPHHLGPWRGQVAALGLAGWGLTGWGLVVAGGLGLLGAAQVTQVRAWDADPGEAARAALGRELFYSPLLSRDGQVSCSSCHHPDKAFTDGRAVSSGAFGRQGLRSAPSLVNVAYRTRLFWHGGSPSLELQALGPLSDHNEHDLRPEEVAQTLEADPYFSARFREVFGEGPRLTSVVQAIAAFERTLVSYGSPFDRYSAGDATALSPAQERGMDLFFGQAECFHCHSGRHFSDNLPHNNGSVLFNEDLGLAQLSGQDEDIGKFITPTLRNVALSAPYMHAGQLASLREVVEHYNAGGQPNPNTDPLVRPLGLSDEEVTDLVAFLESLTDPTVATNPDFGPPPPRAKSPAPGKETP